MLTDKTVDALKPKPDRHQWIETDHKPGDEPGKTCRGFGVKIMRSGTKTYVVSYRVDGREREFVIGSCSEWKCADARKKAGETRRLAKDGKDPQAKRVAARTAPTVEHLVVYYREEFLPRKKPRGQTEDNSIINQWLLPELGKMRVAEVTATHARQLHRKITKGGDGRKGTPVRANRVADLGRHLFNIAIKEKWCDENPFQSLKRNHEDPRERYLDEDSEIERLFAVLDTYPNQQAANLITFLLYTGCRRGEAMAARWDQFSEGRRIWVKPSAHTKQARTHRVPLSTMAIELLDEIYEAQRVEVDQYNQSRGVDQAKRDMPEFVFPARRGGHTVEVKGHWRAICRAAGLKDLRIHDLRHSYASILVNKGLSLQTVGQLLGHTQSSTTMRYAHLNDKSLRAATQKIGEVVPVRKSGRNS